MLDTNGTLEIGVPEKIIGDRRDKPVLLEVLTVSVLKCVVLEPVVGPATDVVQLCWGEGARLADFDIFLRLAGYIVMGSWKEPMVGMMQRNVCIRRGRFYTLGYYQEEYNKEEITKAEWICIFSEYFCHSVGLICEDEP